LQTEIDLAWDAVPEATGYVVSRSTAANGPYSGVGTPVTTSFPDPGLASGTTYFYVVQATNAGGTSGNSAVVSATTLVDPPLLPVGPVVRPAP
jgi:cellulose 1,4-beta-cellobiosidase